MNNPDVIQSLKHILKRQYEQGYDSTCDTLEETIVELERLRATVVSLQDENSHLLAMNRRMVETLTEFEQDCQMIAVKVGEVRDAKPPAYKYPETVCSQCGGEFGPGNEGFSHCQNHKHLPRIG